MTADASSHLNKIFSKIGVAAVVTEIYSKTPPSQNATYSKTGSSYDLTIVGICRLRVLTVVQTEPFVMVSTSQMVEQELGENLQLFNDFFYILWIIEDSNNALNKDFRHLVQQIVNASNFEQDATTKLQVYNKTKIYY